MSYSVPRRLLPVRRELTFSKGAFMLALIAMVLFVLAAFGVHFDEVNIAYLAAAFLAAHFAVPTLPSWGHRG